MSSLTVVKWLEEKRGQVQANIPTIDAMRRALEGAGVEFIHGGTRLRETRGAQP